MTDNSGPYQGYEVTGPCTYFATWEDPLFRRDYPMIKIGISADLRKRLITLSRGAPFRVVAAGAVLNPPNPIDLEKELHKIFHIHRLNGEWFKLTPGMIETIREYDVVNDRFDELFNHLG